MSETGPSTPPPAVSVIIAVRNGWEDTFRLLLGLADRPFSLPREILVVDDGSNDETPLALPHLAGLRLHRNDEPLGLVRAANQGAAMAKGSLLLFLGNGAVVAPGFLEPLLAALAEDSAVAAAGPQRVDPSGAPLPANTALAWAVSSRSSLPATRCSALGRDGLLVRASAFRAAGGFDASYRDRLAEIDLCLRLTAAGSRVLHVPQSTLTLHEDVGAGLPGTAEDEALLASRWEERFGAPRPLPAGRGPAPFTVVPGRELAAAAARRVHPAAVLLDIGRGPRPEPESPPQIHLCCDPSAEGAAELQRVAASRADRQWIVLRSGWADAVDRFAPGSVDAVVVRGADGVEGRDEALALLERTARIARGQVVLSLGLGEAGLLPHELGPGWEVLVAPDAVDRDAAGRALDVPQGVLWAVRSLRQAAEAEPVDVPAARAGQPLGDVARPPFPAVLTGSPATSRLATCTVLPDPDGTYELELRIEEGRRKRGGKVRFARGEPVREVAVPYLAEGSRRLVRPAEMLAFLSNGYDLEKASARLARRGPTEGPARIAFTVNRSDLLGGGTINLFRLANWLVDMGAEVGVYSDSPPPSWVQLNARFHHLPNPAERYAAIEEPVVVAYSVLELPALLRACDHAERRIYHLCQGAEEFHYGSEPPTRLLAPNGAFDLLNSIPVGRIVVSPHLERYFAEKYGQRTLPIVNGVDTDLFRPPPGPRPARKNEFSVVVNGNPIHPLKGIAVAKEAMALLARRHPRWKLRMVNLCGLRFAIPPLLLEDGFAVETRVALSPPEVRDVLQAADACFNSSWYEGFGLPSLEAMACGLPVVQSDNHGLSGVVEDGRDCLLVPVSSPEAAASALERLFLEPELRARLSAAGRETALRHSLARQRDAAAAVFSEITGVRLSAPGGGTIAASGERPRFSVLVPSYNQAQFLPGALDSLLAQTERDWEALVVNDGSTDATAEVMAGYAARDRRIRCFQKENGGVASALDHGLAEARGEWLCWLSSDDLFLPEKLSLHRRVAEVDPGVRFMHTNFRVLHERTGQITPSGLAVEGFIPPQQLQVIRFLHVNYVNGISVAVHRTVFDQVGGFDEEYRYGQDCDLWLRASARYRSRFVDEVTCVTRLHPAQGTALFTEAGIYDSARAGAAFLGRHPFPDLFPTLDLGQPGQALQALSTALVVAFQPDSFLARCGLGQVLVDRMREWIGLQPARPRFAIQSQLELAFEQQAHPEAKAALRELARASPGFRFRPVDPLVLFERHLARLERRGDAKEHAALQRYLGMFGRSRAAAPLARAS